jgi:hypothetical protein
MKKYIVIVMLAFSAQVNALNWTKDAKVNFCVFRAIVTTHSV